MPFSMRQAEGIIRRAIERPLSNGQHRVVYLEGDPGIGKTALMKSVYDQYCRYKDDEIKSAFYAIGKNGEITLSTISKPGFTDNILNKGGFTHFIAYVAPEREPMDWGLPTPNALRDAFSMVPLDEFKFQPTDRPFIFLDEIDKANNMMQNVLGRVMHEQRVGNIVFPRGTFVAAAGNKMTNRAGSMTANTHIKNRRTHVPLFVNSQEWVEDVGIPYDLHPAVISYIRTDHKALHLFDANAPSFPSPRSWTKVGLELNEDMEDYVERAMIEGDVGVDAANTFYGHLQIYRALRNPEEIVRNPTKCDVPNGKDQSAIMYAEVTSLARYANPTNADAIMQYFNRLAGEFGFLGYRDILQRDAKLVASSKAGQVWYAKHGDMLIRTARKKQ